MGIERIIQMQFVHQLSHVVQMGALRAMVIVFGNARGKFHQNLRRLNLVGLLGLLHQECQFAVQRSAAAPAARQIHHTTRLLAKPRKSTITPEERALAVESGASLHHDVTLHHNDIGLPGEPLDFRHARDDNSPHVVHKAGHTASAYRAIATSAIGSTNLNRLKFAVEKFLKKDGGGVGVKAVLLLPARNFLTSSLVLNQRLLGRKTG